MSSTSNNHTVVFLRRSLFSGLFCSSIIATGFGGLATVSFAASQMRVEDGHIGVYEVTGDLTGASAGQDTEFSTGTGAALSVEFPNGMGWQLSEKSRIELQSFAYTGPVMKLQPKQMQWGKGGVKTIAIAAEMAVSTWTARLEEGELFLSALTPKGNSLHIIHTPEVKLSLRASSAAIRRMPGQGTVVDVYKGDVYFILPGGRSFKAAEGTQVTITPEGEIRKSLIDPGSLVWVNPPMNVPLIVAFPSMPVDVIEVSPSS